MDQLGLPELMVAVLGGGGLLGTVTGIVQAVRAYRDGARAQEREVLADSERLRREMDAARREAEWDRDWWRDRAMQIWGHCAGHGGSPPQLGHPPPPPEN